MNSKKTILLVVNPVSGGEDKTDLICDVEVEVDRNNKRFVVFETTGENDAKKLEKELSDETLERVLVAGGDGTIKLVASVLEGKDIPIGILPAGSANGLATHFQIPEERKQQIEIALGDHFIAMDRLKLNDQICLHVADLGINAELIKNYEESQIRGKLGYLLQSIPTLIDCEYPFQFSIEAEGQKWEKEGVLLAIANARKFGTGATINPDGKINDKKFELVLFKKLDIIEIIKTVRDKVKLDPEFAETISTDKAVIRTDGSIPFQIDGEYLGTVDKVEILVCPDPLEVAVPEFVHS
ncbi:diacylglycerol/lipid kinase family protein [Luteirhabdus pelagi]|uniref:diacylglycerol/lipid kinase family protein n=1 Tax=Luteirhabdus pelagi TaxID=2792783 RepID=UPI0019396CFC|nr:YegS/Rv2252/BmrU family lipid kinase [Luteirhabdus pelagi]